MDRLVTSEMMILGKGHLSCYTRGARFIPQRDSDRLSSFIQRCMLDQNKDIVSMRVQTDM